ncbi:MAG: hypothetical protein JSU01_11175 [Bacteroidetes bacterium]|nr:hypothetical protein [Bacteroidota bacterium]
MKALIIMAMLSVMVITSCQKKPLNSAEPPHVIYFQLASVQDEFVSVYYIDSISGKNIKVQIRPWVAGSDNTIYADSIPTTNFGSAFLFNACSDKGIKNFKLKFYKAGVTELHDLNIDFKWLPPPGGFEIPDAAIDGKNLTALPPSDSNGAGHYDTGFIYDRN